MWSLGGVILSGVLFFGFCPGGVVLSGVCTPLELEKQAVRIPLECFLVVVIILVMSVNINYKINKISVTDEYCKSRII